MKEQIEKILGKKLQVMQQSPLVFTCQDYGSPYNVAHCLFNSDLRFGTLVLNERQSVLVTEGEAREAMTIHKGHANPGITFFS